MPAKEFIGKGSMSDEDASKQTALQNAVYQMVSHMSGNKCYHVVIGRPQIHEFPEEGVQMSEKAKIEQRIKDLELEVERQRNGHYCHFTSGNIALLLNRICDLERELAALKGGAK